MDNRDRLFDDEASDESGDDEVVQLMEVEDSDEEEDDLDGFITHDQELPSREIGAQKRKRDYVNYDSKVTRSEMAEELRELDDGYELPEKRARYDDDAGEGDIYEDVAEENPDEDDDIIDMSQGMAPQNVDGFFENDDYEDNDITTTKRKLKHTMDPSVLEDNLMTEKDDIVRQTDEPERLQPLIAGGIVEGDELYEEAKFLLLEIHPTLLLEEHDLEVQQVEAFLKYVFVKKMDVPFIYCYRHKPVSSLPLDDMYRLVAAHPKYLLMRRRRADTQQKIERSLELLKIQEAAELETKDDDDFAMTKTAEKIDMFNFCLTQLRQLSSNNEIQDIMDFANFLNKLRIDYSLSNPKHLSRHPHVRSIVREEYCKELCITVVPTPRGWNEIDNGHFLHKVKHIENKPMNEFFGCCCNMGDICKADCLFQYLLIEEGVKQDLLKVYYTLGGSHTEIDDDGNVTKDHNQEVFNQVAEAILQRVSEVDIAGAELINDEWKSSMQSTIFTSLNQILLPAMKRECKDRLMKNAESELASTCGTLFKNQILQKGFREINERQEEEPSIMMGIVMTEVGRNQENRAVVIDEGGEVIDQTKLPALRERAALVDCLMTFITNNKPNCIGISANCSMSRSLLRIVQDIVDEFKQERVLSNNALVTFVNEEVPRIFSHCQSGTKEFPSYSVPDKHAVGVARLLQDPLTIYASLFNVEGENCDALSLKLHRFQHRVNPELMFKAFEREMISSVNIVGCDINDVLKHPHKEHIVQFVCGLGRRKAANLLAALKVHGSEVQTRAFLTNFMGPKVLKNAIGFIKVGDIGMILDREEEDIQAHPLDCTRIHPESYSIAGRICMSCAEDQENSDASLDGMDAATREDFFINLICGTMEKFQNEDAVTMERIGDLDLDAYAQTIQQQSSQKSYVTEQMLSNTIYEMMEPFLDKRNDFGVPKEETVFEWITGETPETLRVGMLVAVEVSDLKEVGARVRLPCGITGFIHISQISDDRLESPAEKMTVGQTINAKITEISPTHFNVRLTSKRSELSAEVENVDDVDRYCVVRELPPHVDPKYKMREANREKKLFSRSINHAHFKNITEEEAEEELEEEQMGKYIIHPSSRGKHYLGITLKVYPGRFQHIQILEKDKSGAEIGRCLTIGDKDFEELDEIIEVYLNPVIANIDNIVQHRKFTDRTQQEVDTDLINFVHNNPGRFDYKINMHDTYHGYFVLSYIKTEPRHIYIKNTPDGFVFCGKTHKGVVDLLNWFKMNHKNINQIAARLQPQQQNQHHDHQQDQQYGMHQQQQQYGMQQQDQQYDMQNQYDNQYAQPYGSYDNYSQQNYEPDTSNTGYY